MARHEPAGFDAVVLAGGAALRFGGDKPGALLGGRSLVSRVAAAASAAGRLILVGPARPELPYAVVVREDPPGAGPVPALRRGLAEVRAERAAVLAADLPLLTAAHLDLLLAASRGRAGAVFTDGGGREQWLAGVWDATALRAALSAYDGTSLRGLLGPLRPALVPGPEATWLDCDTPDDLAEAARRL